jgi:hypothetical protein
MAKAIPAVMFLLLPLVSAVQYEIDLNQSELPHSYSRTFNFFYLNESVTYTVSGNISFDKPTVSISPEQIVDNLTVSLDLPLSTPPGQYSYSVLLANNNSNGANISYEFIFNILQDASLYNISNITPIINVTNKTFIYPPYYDALLPINTTEYIDFYAQNGTLIEILCGPYLACPNNVFFMPTTDEHYVYTLYVNLPKNMTPGDYQSYVNITTNSSWGAYKFHFKILSTPVVIKEIVYNMTGDINKSIEDMSEEELMEFLTYMENLSRRRLLEWQAIQDKQVETKIVEKNVTVQQPVILSEMDQHIVKMCVETGEALKGKVNADLEERNQLRRDNAVCQSQKSETEAMVGQLNGTMFNMSLDHQANMQMFNATMHANNFVWDKRKTKLVFWSTLISISFAAGLVVAWKQAHPYQGSIFKW